MCGNSTSETDVDKLMDEHIADLIVTDPPYNVNLGYINKKKLMDHKEHYKGANTDEIANDNLEPTQFKDFLCSAFYNLAKNLKAGGSFYIWHAESSSSQFEDAMEENGLDVHQRIIWNKNTITLGFSDYQWKHEPCYYGWKIGAPHYFVDDRTKKTVIELEQKPFEDMKKDELVNMLNDIYANAKTSIINEDKPAKSDLHPTMKPIKLMGQLVENSSKQNEIVLDLFGGSGSTLIACEQLNRTCYMMEYEPKYVDVIVERWENYTGKKAVLISE